MAVAQTPSYSQWINQNEHMVDGVLGTQAPPTITVEEPTVTYFNQEPTQDLGSEIVADQLSIAAAQTAENKKLADIQTKTTKELADKQAKQANQTNFMNQAQGMASGIQQRQAPPQQIGQSGYQSKTTGAVKSDAPTGQIGAPMKPAIGTIMKVVGAIFSYGASAGADKAGNAGFKDTGNAGVDPVKTPDTATGGTGGGLLG